MHAAPSVSYPVGRSRFALAFSAAAWLAGVCGLAAWWLHTRATPLQELAAAASILIPGAAAARAWFRSPQGEISWNGEVWTWAGSEAGVPLAALDLQRVMLLRWTSGPRTRWLWLERASRPLRWDDLRRAVYSRAPNP